MDLIKNKVDEVEVPHFVVGLTISDKLIGKSKDQRMPPRIDHILCFAPSGKRPYKDFA